MEHRCQEIINEELHINKGRNLPLRLSLQLIDGAWRIFCIKLSKDSYKFCPYCQNKLAVQKQVDIT
jgi:hypothetical protein